MRVQTRIAPEYRYEIHQHTYKRSRNRGRTATRGKQVEARRKTRVP